ncbi:hypothetical protein B0G83_12365 [Paraburkholderia sp. BL21I4N1]|nr:hypothetical protein B0G83_12365 [Paraburkholderia sp. BL21I4N1]
MRVDYSMLAHKVALAITGRGPVVRQFPLGPGIDFAGTIEASDHSDYGPHDRALLNGWGVGEARSSGLSQKACVRGEWLIPPPLGSTAPQAVAIGTAGYTAMLSILVLERHGLKPEQGDVLVTGATAGEALQWRCWRDWGTASSRRPDGPRRSGICVG